MSILGMFLAFVFSTGSALADLTQDCDQSKVPDRSIRACTQIIDDNKCSTIQCRVSAHRSRGVAYHTKARKLLFGSSKSGSTKTIVDDLNQALADFSRAIELGPNEAITYVLRAHILLYGKHWEKMIADCTRAIEIDPKFAEAYSTRAGAYEELGDASRAIADYKMALSIDPKYQASKDALKRLGASR